MTYDEEVRLIAVVLSVVVLVAYAVLFIKAKDKTPWIILFLVMVLVALVSFVAKECTGVN